MAKEIKDAVYALDMFDQKIRVSDRVLHGLRGSCSNGVEYSLGIVTKVSDVFYEDGTTRRVLKFTKVNSTLRQTNIPHETKWVSPGNVYKIGDASTYIPRADTNG